MIESISGDSFIRTIKDPVLEVCRGADASLIRRPGAPVNAASVVAVLLALFFGCLGAAKILATPSMRVRAAHVGFSAAAYRAIGALEVAAAIGLLIGLVAPLVGGLAGIGLVLLLVGALVAHLRTGDGLGEIAPALVSGLLVLAYLLLLAITA
jgi:hypothetical protein